MMELITNYCWVAARSLPARVRIKSIKALSKDDPGMKISTKWLHCTVTVLAVTLFGSLKSAHADSYTIYVLGQDRTNDMIGINTAGAAVTFNPFCSELNPNACYTTYVDGVAVSQSMTAPGLVYDNGGPCSSLPAGFDVTRSVCNNGRIGFGSGNGEDGQLLAAYIGSSSAPEPLGPGSVDKIFLNSAGDILWDDGQDNEIFEAIDTSVVPEPSSLLLLVTGLASLTTPIRRKMKA